MKKINNVKYVYVKGFNKTLTKPEGGLISVYGL